MRLLIILSVFIFSCSKYTPQKAIADVNKANDNYPAPVAEWLRGKYPCITKASDTVLLIKDSVIYIECPDLPEIITMPGDTIYKTVFKTVKVPVRTQIITKYIEDSAKIKVMQFAIDFEKEKYSKLAERYSEKAKECFDEKEKRQRNGWQRNWLILLIITYFTLRVLKGIANKSNPAGFIGRVAKGVLKFII